MPDGISEIIDYEISFGYEIYFVYGGINFISFFRSKNFIIFNYFILLAILHETS